MKKIILIEPKAPRDHVYTRAHIARLGLPILGAQLYKMGFQVKIYVEDILPIDWNDVAGATYVGISTTTSTAPAAYRIGSLVKQRWPEKIVILGGAHVTFMSNEPFEAATVHRFYGLTNPICDYVVVGEGELLLPELIAQLEAGETPPNHIVGERLRVGSKIRPSTITDLDALPFPARDLIVHGSKQPIATIITSRGCPFDCIFCSVIEMMGRCVRYRSIESVIDELAYMRVKDYRHVFFADDNLTANPDRAVTLLEAMMRAKVVPNQWSAQVRATEICKHPELLRLMKRTNCTFLYLGLESVNQATLNACHKRQTLEQIVEAIEIIHRHGIRSHGMFVVGFDDDTAQTVRDTATFAIRHGINTIQIFPPIPLPGTRFYEEMVAGSRLLHQDWTAFDGAEVVFQPKLISPGELQREIFRAMQMMYALPRCIAPFIHGDMYTMLFRGYARHMLKRAAAQNAHLVAKHNRLTYSM